MKKCLCVLLAVLLLLSGCGQKAAEQTIAPATEPVTTGLYDPDHPIEQQTVGAIRAYPLGGNNYVDIALMGNKLLLLRDDGTARVLQGENCEVLAEGTVGIGSFSESHYSIHAQGLAVYQQSTKEVVRINPQLQEVERIALPQDMQGEPVICLESNEIFYCQGGQIRALNMENSIPRLLKSHTVADQTLTGCFFGGKVIRCETTDAEGLKTTLYLSAENGLTLSQDTGIFLLETYEDRYFVQRSDYMVLQNIVGTRGETPSSLVTQEDRGEMLTEALAMNGIVSYYATEGGVELLFHDLNTAQTTAKILLTDAQAPVAIAADQQYVWMIVEEGEQQVLYRWDVTLSAMEEAVAAVAPLYTAQNPDIQGLEACEDMADQFQDDYGVKIRIWEDALPEEETYSVVLEHQPAIITNMFTQLEPALQMFPESFLRKTVRSGWIRIGFVRSIDEDCDWVQFWEDGDCCILISAQADPAQAFLEAVGYGIDSFVIGNSRDYDTWNKLNPDGFTYGGELPVDENGAVLYLEGVNRAFVNQEAMNSPAEDRRQLLIAAITEGNAEVFASEVMQSKLRRMCEGIREAYGLEKKKELYLWEQYLTEPMVEIVQENG